MQPVRINGKMTKIQNSFTVINGFVQKEIFLLQFNFSTRSRCAISIENCTTYQVKLNLYFRKPRVREEQPDAAALVQKDTRSVPVPEVQASVKLVLIRVLPARSTLVVEIQAPSLRAAITVRPARLTLPALRMPAVTVAMSVTASYAICKPVTSAVGLKIGPATILI